MSSAAPALDFVTRPAFSVAGIEGSGPAARGPEWIAPLWQQASQRRAEIEPLINGPAWGMMSDVECWLQPWTDRGRYLAGWEIDARQPPPAGWSLWQIPASTFAVLPCTLATEGAALSRLRELLAADHVQAGAIHEFYPLPITDPATDLLVLCTAVAPRTS